MRIGAGRRSAMIGLETKQQQSRLKCVGISSPKRWCPRLTAASSVGNVQQMTVNRYALGLVFCCFYVVSYFTNKYVLSVLKFTYPTLFQGWQTFVGGLLLLVSGRLGLVEISRFPRAVVLSWLPGSLLFVGNIYAGSRALSRLPIPMFFTLHNASEVVTHMTSRLTHKEHASWTKLLSVSLLLASAVSLPLVDPQFDPGGYFWAVIHCLCVGAYRVFQKLPKYSHLSDLEQQCINYIFSVLLLAVAAHPTGDLFGVFEFPFLQSYRFHSGCCARLTLMKHWITANTRSPCHPS